MESEPRHKRPKLDHEDVASPETDVATPQTEGATAEKHVNDLQGELLVKILGYLPRHDLVRNASAVCWRWHEAAFDQDNWKEIDVRVGDKMTMQDLRRLVKKCTKKLRITLYEEMLDETFPRVLEKCSTLHTLILNVENFQQDSSDTDFMVKSDSTRTSSPLALTSIEQHCGDSLRKLVLHQIDGLNDTILISILRSCNKVDELFLVLCKNLSTSVLSVIGEHASQLTQLSSQFAKDKRLSDHSIENLVDRCPKLQVLDVSANFSIHTNWKYIGKLQFLRVLAITTIDISVSTGLIEDDTIIHWINNCRLMKCLSVYSPLMTDITLEVIALSKLTRFDMLIPSGITPQGLELLASSKTLRIINMFVQRASVTVDANEIVKLAQNLKTLEAMIVLVQHSNHPLYKQMEEISSVWKGVYPISVKSLQSIRSKMLGSNKIKLCYGQ